MSGSEIDLSLVEDIVLGDLVGITPHIKVEITAKTVQLQPMLAVNLKVTIRDRHIISKAIIATAAESIPLATIPQTEAGRFSHIVEVIQEMAKKMSYRLFEHDPRIGMRFQEDFPNSPLFDPPYVTTTFREWNHQTRRRGYKDDMTEALSKCPFCNRYFTEDELFSADPPVVWCGGNVGFAHTHCAPWLLP